MEHYFTLEADKEYQAWRKTNKKILKKINDLIADIKKNGMLNGIGKPEQLKHFDEPIYSRHITQGDRLVDCPFNENDLLIISCKGHYNDK